MGTKNDTIVEEGSKKTVNVDSWPPKVRITGSYPCEICKYMFFANESSLKRHVEKEHKHNERKIVLLACENCDYKSIRPENFEVHKQTCPKNGNNPTTPNCILEKNEEQLRSVSNKPTKEDEKVSPVYCNFCQKVFINQLFLSRHLLKHEQSTDRSHGLLVCDVCEYRTYRSSDLKKHKCAKPEETSSRPLGLLGLEHAQPTDNAKSKDTSTKDPNYEPTLRLRRILVCDVCKYWTYQSSDFKTHKCAKSEDRPTSMKTGRNLHCGLCSFKTLLNQEIMNHFKTFHAIEMKIMKLKFLKLCEFEHWMEHSNNNKFLRILDFKTSSWERKRRYVCRYNYNLKNDLGTNEVKGFCPAKIDVSVRVNGVVYVEYTKTHISHHPEGMRIKRSTNNQPVLTTRTIKTIQSNKTVKKSNCATAKFNSKNRSATPEFFEEIASDSTNLPRYSSRDTGKFNSKNRSAAPEFFNEIGSANTNLPRYSSRPKQVFHNIAQEFGAGDEPPSLDGISSIKAWVAEAKENAILRMFYKERGENCEEYPGLLEDDFVLVLMTEWQREVLMQSCSQIIAVDSTQNLFSNALIVTTLMILDQRLRRFPCAFLFSSSVSRRVLTVFFSTIFADLTYMTPKVFMSDVAEDFYAAWKEVMGPVPRRLYSSWAVEDDWRKTLANVRTTPPNRETTYDELITLKKEPNVYPFKIRLGETIQRLKSNSITAAFGSHFEKKYGDRTDPWAHCHRQSLGRNIVENLDKMYEVIKHYVNAETVENIGTALCGVLETLRKEMIDRLIIPSPFKGSVKILEIIDRHNKSINSNAQVDVIAEDVWRVQSKINGYFYQVRRVPLKSPCSCVIRCLDCNECIHGFECTCSDSYISGNMCEHVHLVKRVGPICYQTVSVPDIELESTQVDEDLTLVPDFETVMVTDVDYSNEDEFRPTITSTQSIKSLSSHLESNESTQADEDVLFPLFSYVD